MATTDVYAEFIYNEDWDTDAVYASLGHLADGGLFRLKKRDDDTHYWDYVPPTSPSFYWITERIWAAHKVDWIRDPERIASFPPIPPVPSGPYPPTESYHLPKDPLKAKDYPRTREWLLNCPSRRGVLYVVLNEDTWETAHGDGRFLYLDNVFATEAEARTFPTGTGLSYSAAQLPLRLVDDGTVDFTGFRISSGESYTPEAVVARFESNLDKDKGEGSLAI